MGKIWREDIIYKIVAISLAILLWLYVTADGNSPIERSFTLNLDYLNLSNELALVGSVETVDIILRGDERVISRLSENDLRATVDASQLTPGDHSLPVRIANPTGTEVIDIYPKEAKITVDRVAEKQVPVTLALLGETAHGYSSFKATVKPSHIVLRGPVSILETIVEARAEVNLDSAQTNLTLNLPVKVQDKWGNFYNGNMFTLTPSTVEVFVPIVSDTPSKTVPIRVSLEGSPAVNYRVSRTIIEPETVQILGSLNALDKIDFIQARTVSVSGISENKVTEVGLIAPDGVTFSSVEKVKVIIQVEEVRKEKEFEKNLVIRNVGENHEVILNTPTVKVQLEGLGNSIDKVTADDIEVFIDVKDLEPGLHEVLVQYRKPQDVGLIKIEPQKVDIEIRKKESVDSGNNSTS